MVDARQAVQMAAREAYGRLLAWLASRSGDLAGAEDALADALVAELGTWPDSGVPERPEAWLLTVARRKLIDQRRRAAVRGHVATTIALSEQWRWHHEATEAVEGAFRDVLPDRRLELMFLCAHPDIPREMRTPLMLQTVLGLNAERIGSTMLVAPRTMGQRLVRLKRRIGRDAIPFEVPSPEALPERLFHVLEAIYAAYGTGWESDVDLGDGHTGLTFEALWLARLLVTLMPDEPEAKGLYALLCFCESRRSARRNALGDYVPLEEQDTTQWDHERILEGEKALWIAAKAARGGPFQTEAAIHSIHAHRARSGRTDWHGIHRLYRVLVDQFPSLGGRIGYAASCGRVGQAAEGLHQLDAIASSVVDRHQPYWAVRGWLLRELERHGEAREAYGRAMGLCSDAAVRRWLHRQLPSD